jgi:hypothetical protein
MRFAAKVQSPWSLTKRQFVKLAGLAIADGIFPRWLRASKHPSGQNKVIIVTFGGGVRYAETFSPEGARNIPRLMELKPQGHFFQKCVNSGVLSHFNSTASIVTGNWQRVDDFGFQPPASPTLFELYRKQRSASALDAWAIATNKSFATMGASSDGRFGERFGANVILPKQLLLEAVQSVVRKGSEGGVANRDLVLDHLEGVLNEGYEGVGWTIFKANRELDQKVRSALLHGLVEYINGPEAPTSGDELTFFITREVMREFAPRLLLVNFWDMDVAHWGSYSLYLQAITKTDRLCGMLWEEVQANANYRDKTTLLILPELGRDGDINTANGFLNHRSGDPSCRNVWLLALGAGVPKGETERAVQHVDVAATAAELLGFSCDAAGHALRELSL